MKASATWINKDRFAGVATSGHALVMDAGETKHASSPLELVLIGLCGCTATDVAMILRKKRQPFTFLEVHAAAERAPEPPQVFTAIHLLYRISSTVESKAIEDAVRLSQEKYCSVAQMLAKTATITSEIEYVD